MTIEVIEECVTEDNKTGKRTVVYDSDKSSLLDALSDYENAFDVDKIISTGDDFECECVHSAVVSVRITNTLLEEINK